MKFFKRSDIVIIATILLLSLVSWVLYDLFSRDRLVKAEIYYYSDLIETVPLDRKEERTFSIPQNPNVVFQLDKEGGIAFISSDCPDKVCVHTGKIHRVGEYAACLPNGILLKIVPEGEREDGDVDIIVGRSQDIRAHPAAGPALMAGKAKTTAPQADRKRMKIW